MRVRIIRANDAGVFDANDAQHVKELKNLRESAAMWQAVKFALGRAYRIEFYGIESCGDKNAPFKTLEQLALPSGAFEIKPGLETPKVLMAAIETENGIEIFEED